MDGPADDALPPVAPGMLRFYEALSALSPPESTAWPLPEQRRGWEEVCRAFQAPRPPGIAVEDLVVPGPGGAVPVRLYRPAAAGPLPGVLYGHGGGWVLGSLETHDDMCAELADAAGVVVAAVDYRLAPENRHPAQLDDMLAVLAWLRAEGARHGIDPGRILGAGDSAGGQLTAGAALVLRDRGLPAFVGQVLIYPVLGGDTDTPSYRRNAHAPCLTLEEMDYFLQAFLGPPGAPAWTDPTALPLLAADLAGLPPAFITVAGHDPLHDDGVRFHERLGAAGVPSRLRREPELAHSYMRARHHSGPAMAGFRAIAEAVRVLAREGRLPPA
ncbi:alpha/beta hydrolase [Prosthecomicrobium sp. N25]|uniref:alpha/beta hydrolase n=1 Tax=Prosthecomicrobium sp. N25 TaxID=3129254 RepID=UPI003077B0F8